VLPLEADNPDDLRLSLQVLNNDGLGHDLGQFWISVQMRRRLRGVRYVDRPYITFSFAFVAVVAFRIPIRQRYDGHRLLFRHAAPG
jgi:hypothetical protein